MQIPEELVRYITAEIIKRFNQPPAKPALCLVGSRRDISPSALSALEGEYEVTEQAGWNHSVPVGAALLFTAPFLAKSGLIKSARKSVAASPAPGPAGAGVPGKRPVITESEIIKFCPPSSGEGQELKLPQGAVITPLARDYIRAMKINLS